MYSSYHLPSRLELCERVTSDIEYKLIVSVWYQPSCGGTGPWFILVQLGFGRVIFAITDVP